MSRKHQALSQHTDPQVLHDCPSKTHTSKPELFSTSYPACPLILLQTRVPSTPIFASSFPSSSVYTLSFRAPVFLITTYSNSWHADTCATSSMPSQHPSNPLQPAQCILFCSFCTYNLSNDTLATTHHSHTLQKQARAKAEYAAARRCLTGAVPPAAAAPAATRAPAPHPAAAARAAAAGPLLRCAAAPPPLLSALGSAA